MKNAKPGIFTSVCLLTVLLTVSRSAAAAEFSVPLADNAELNISLRLLPPVRAWRMTGPSSYTGGGYELTLQPAPEGARTDLAVRLSRPDQQSFSVLEFRATWELRDDRLFAAWSYGLDARTHRNYRALASEAFGDIITPNSGIPYALLATREGQNLLAAGILSQDRVATLHGAPLEDQDGYLLTVYFSAARAMSFEEIIFSDLTPSGCFETTRKYARWVDRLRHYEPFPIPPAGYEPMYDIWYWAKDQTNLDLYWQTLVNAKSLGFQSYLFDAGWESRTGELGLWLLGATGNYFAPQDKLPGFTGFLQKVKQTLQMNIILWVAPYIMGRKSVYYPALKDVHTLFASSRQTFRGGAQGVLQTLPLSVEYDENVNLCPRHPATADHVKSLFNRISDTYPVDGYWLDFQDAIPFRCEAPHHAHLTSFGTGYASAQAAIKESILSRGGQPTVELRYPVANLNNKPYGNIWQSTDSPEDFDAMRLYNMVLRPFSEGVVMGTDEMYWPTTAAAGSVAKFVATTVFSGVPAFGADFLKGPRSHSDIVRAWLDFYKTHREGLTQGEFEPIGDFVFPDQKIESEEEAFVYLRSGGRIELAVRAPSRLYVANCTNTDSIALLLQGIEPGDYKVRVLDIYLRPISGWTETAGSDMEVRAAVPQGGMLEIALVSNG